MRFMKRRVQVAQRNLALCFPDMPTSEREAMVKHNFESVGMGLIETGMAWFWPDWRIRKWVSTSGGTRYRGAGTKARHPADWHALPDAGAGCARVWHVQPGHWRVSP